jgi:hypothetical protein
MKNRTAAAKALLLQNLYGTAEAVPFVKRVFFRSLLVRFSWCGSVTMGNGPCLAVGRTSY